ncbi:hypothetical protein ACFYNO_32760 [Kitasatospora sp. NPDC006697]|uniref:hypothetical protein n=1 Tax=Kitasatospora sp. NPDC006697 TaxID=3364020 RepID=UPI00367FCBF4
MDVHELLQLESAEIERVFEDHDPWAFVGRLAQRIADGDGSPAARAVIRSERAPASTRPAPAARAPQKRAQHDPVTAAARGDLRRDLEHLCASVAGEAEAAELAGFLDGIDQVVEGATVFGCVMYAIGRPEAAELWWGVAAGAEDELAAHCLAVHYAATGQPDRAEVWRSQAAEEITPGRLPMPVRLPGDPAEIARALASEIDDLALAEFVSPDPQSPPGPMPPGGKVVRARNSPRRRRPVNRPA